MQIPKKVRVGRSWYEVQQVSKLPGNSLGCVDHDAKTIHVAGHAYDKRLGKTEISDTFWHELTHAILNDMNHELVTNERFVQQFATRLNNAINSARF